MSLMFYNSIMTFSEILNRWNLLKIGTQIIYCSDFEYFAAIFTKGT